MPTHLIAGLAVTLSIVFSASLLAQETDNAPEMKRLQTDHAVGNQRGTQLGAAGT